MGDKLGDRSGHKRIPLEYSVSGIRQLALERIYIGANYNDETAGGSPWMVV